MEKSKYPVVAVFAIAVLFLCTNHVFAGEAEEVLEEAEEDKVAFGLALGTTTVMSSSSSSYDNKGAELVDHDDRIPNFMINSQHQQQKSSSFFNLSSIDSRRMLHGHHHNKCCQPDYCSECCHPCPKCCEYGRRRK